MSDKMILLPLDAAIYKNLLDKPVLLSEEQYNSCRPWEQLVAPQSSCHPETTSFWGTRSGRENRRIPSLAKTLSVIALSPIAICCLVDTYFTWTWWLQLVRQKSGRIMLVFLQRVTCKSKSMGTVQMADGGKVQSLLELREFEEFHC